MYWNAAFSDGVSGESTRDVIDIDESNYKLESQNRKFGKVTREKRCDARGKYKKGAGSVSLLMAILGVTRELGRHFLSTGASPRGGGNLWHFFNYAEFNGLAVQ